MGTPFDQLECCTFQDCMVPAQHPGSAYPKALSRLVSTYPYLWASICVSPSPQDRLRGPQPAGIMSAGSFSAILAAAIALLLVASTAGGRPLAGKCRMPWGITKFMRSRLPRYAPSGNFGSSTLSRIQALTVVAFDTYCMQVKRNV